MSADATALAVAATLGAYVLGDAVFRKTRLWVLHPVIVATAALAVGIRLAGIELAAYERGGRLISAFLGPSVVALGLTLHEQKQLLRGRAGRLVASAAAGSAVGVVSAVSIARALGAPRVLAASLSAKSVTTPIAMAIAERVGGDPPLTGAIVIAVGAFGAVVGPPLLRACGVRSPLAFGLAMGASAHGIGTARAVEEGPAEGAASALGICLCGLFTGLLAPPFVALVERVFPFAR